MAISVERFLDSLNSSGLVASAQTSSLREQYSDADGETIADQLVADGLLTQYQAHAVCADQVKHLKLGEYTIIDKIGEGGMGQVFKALHNRMDRFAAIKILSDNSLFDRNSADRFNQEVRVAAQIAHPNIVMTYDASEQNGIQYLVMEYIDGEDVGTLLAAHGPLSVSEAIDVMLQTAKGLEYAHQRQVVHRDIKPGNLLLDQQGVVKILDMGLARRSGDPEALAVTAAERLTSAGQVMGTLDFMAPEQAESARNADARSDIYSLGCTTYQLLTGNVPYPAQSVVESIMSHREAPLPSLQNACPDVPQWLDDIAGKCMSKRPEDRYQSATELIRAIELSLDKSEFVASSVAGIRSALTRVGWFLSSTAKGAPTFITGARDTLRRGPASVQSNQAGFAARVQGAGDQVPTVPPQQVPHGTGGPVPLAQQFTQAQQFNQSPPSTLAPRLSGRRRRRRGFSILIIGALGLWLSPDTVGLVCGLIAAVMGRSDLVSMNADPMNARGKRATMLGMVLGILAIANAAFHAASSFFGN